MVKLGVGAMISSVHAVKIVIRRVEHSLRHGNADYDNSFGILAYARGMMFFRRVVKARHGGEANSFDLRAQKFFNGLF